MIVTAMLAWYDEPLDLLEHAVSSLEGFADSLVASDGGYELTPSARDRSPIEQWGTIRLAAKRAGLSWQFGKTGVWRGQVHKRNELLKVGVAGSDWVMPLDADWVLSGDKLAARAQLESTRADSMLVKFTTPKNPDRPLEQTSATPWHTEMVGSQFLPLVYRVLPDMRVKDHHWSYSGVKTGQRVALWGTDGWPANQDILAGLEIEHRCHFRDDRTIERNRLFCAARDRQVHETGVEA